MMGSSTAILLYASLRNNVILLLLLLRVHSDIRGKGNKGDEGGEKKTSILETKARRTRSYYLVEPS